MNGRSGWLRRSARLVLPLAIAIGASSSAGVVPAGSPSGAAAGANDPSTATQPDGRPNIVLCLADDWSWPHAGIFGDRTVRTPNFDRVATEGILFDNAFSAAPTCTPSRLSLLTGQYPHRLGVGANHMVKLPKDWDVYPELLEQAGYYVGKWKKGCSPGTLRGTAWKHDPAGRDFVSFSAFLDSVPEGKPFCFWVGSHEPHRPYDRVLTVSAGTPMDSLVVPGFLPDTRLVREDLLDYYTAVQSFDETVGKVLADLAGRRLLDNTIVVVTSDNGMPFPRAKANCYDAGTRVPLAVMWPRGAPPGRRSQAFVSLSDLAPTFLEAAGIEPPGQMTAHSLMPLLTGRDERGNAVTRFFARLFGRRGPRRDMVFVERERHALGRGRRPGGQQGFLSYPIRGVRTERYLYLRNLRYHLWPACDSPDFKDVDYSPSKMELLYSAGDPASGVLKFYKLAFDMRPAEELFDVVNDPYQLKNLAEDPAYAKVKKELRARVDEWMKKTGDPRAKGEDDRWDYCGWYEADMKPFIPWRPGEVEEKATGD